MDGGLLLLDDWCVLADRSDASSEESESHSVDEEDEKEEMVED
jgi:hypothetical protein